MTLDYFYGQSGELFSYFRIPKALFQDCRFRQLSTDARTLYGILLDRMSLSAKNGWLDEQGRVYIIYTVREVQESLCCAEHKAVKLFRELEDIDLIERKRRGLGRPSLIYVKDFSSGLPKAQVQNCPNSNSGAAESAILEQPKPQANKTDKNKTEWNDPDPIYSGGIREQLEEYFPNVSQMTLRRDLFQLEEEGKIIRVRGGAMSVKEVQKASGEPYTKKATIHTDEKIEIAQKAAVLVAEGSSIFIDGGTTALYLAKELRDMNCNVFTNGIAVAKELAQKKNVTINLLGGQLIKENLSTASPLAAQYFTDTNFELAIISASAFTPENGFSCGSQIEADLLKLVRKKAKFLYMMLDSSKIGKIMPYTFARAEDINVLITDEGFPESLKEQFKAMDIVVM